MKSSNHQQAIAVFGIVIPFLLIGAMIGATLYGRGKVSQTHSEKVSNYERFKMARIYADAMETTLAQGQSGRRSPTGAANLRLISFNQSLKIWITSSTNMSPPSCAAPVWDKLLEQAASELPLTIPTHEFN